jgi:hypothetical protein
MPADWEQKARQKRDALADKIPSEWRLPSHLIERGKTTDNILGIPRESGILSDDELTITENYDATAQLSAT